jgi:putative hydrolase of the HAD superfamily
VTAVSLPERVDVVFCDVGGPIYSDDNFTSAVLAGLDDLRAERGEGPVDRGAFTAIFEELRTTQSGGLRRRLARDLLGDESLRHALHERTAKHWVHPPGTLYPDALALFRELHGHVTLGVVANQEATTVEALRRDGFGELIDIWGISALVGHEKPSREFFEWALAEAGTDAEHAVHIGNRLDTDVRPAKALGMGTVWVTRGEAPSDPTPEQLAEADLSVPDLTAVAAALLPRARTRG